MNLGDMIFEYRSEADDNTVPAMCSDDEVRRFLNQGAKEVCRRSHLIVDSDTPEICVINVVAGQASYPIDKRILLMTRVVNTSKSNRMLRPCKAELMDQFLPNWQSRSGEPDRYIIGLNSAKITLYPIPKADAILNLTVIRLPLKDLESPMDEPEFKEEYHQGMVQWALHRAYSKKDVELFDQDKSNKALQKFEAEFGTRDMAQAAIEQMELNQQSWHFNSGLN